MWGWNKVCGIEYNVGLRQRDRAHLWMESHAPVVVLSGARHFRHLFRAVGGVGFVRVRVGGVIDGLEGEQT